MGSIAIITGSPGGGETTLAYRLACEAPRGLHRRSDVFYTFPARTIHPTTSESRDQNAALIRAVTQASISRADSGYDVYLDGICGPWFVDLITKELTQGRVRAHYVILSVELEEAQRRVAARSSEPDGVTRRRDRWEPGSIEHMNVAFQELGRFESHASLSASRWAA